MWMQRILGIVILMMASPILCGLSITAAAPWEEPQDTAVALTESDRYAWQLFVAVNWPADIPHKVADAEQLFGAEGPVVWETWRNVRNAAPDTAFPPGGSDPGSWLTPSIPLARNVEHFDTTPLQLVARARMLAATGQPLPAFDLVPAEESINETRMNKTTYEFVRQHELYNIEGQEALVARGVDTSEFPLNAKEVKAQWREIAAADKSRYHWTEVRTSASEMKIYGLTALHITTKDLPNWFWATFEHIDNKLAEADGGRAGNEGWLLPSRDRFACPTPPYDCEQVPPGIGLQGTKWEHYRLRGTQVDFIDSRGNATHLANSQPEQNFQQTSSCITCHARATIGSMAGPRANRLSIFDTNGQSHFDPPQTSWFNPPGSGQRYTQLDFVWSFFRAQRKQE